MAEAAAHEDATLNNPFGHNTELKKKFGFLSMLGISFVILGTWTAAGASMNIALPSGGPVATVYGIIVAGLGMLAVTLSLAEMCSVYPTNGAQYEWTAVMASPKHERFLSYVCGWVVTASWWALAATGPSLFATLAISLVQLYNENYVFQPWHQFLIYIGVEIMAGLTNIFGTAIIPWMGKGAFILSVAGFVSISIALLALTAGKHQSAEFVFASFINQTGWDDGTAWLLGLMQGCFVLIGVDATAHLVEEMPNPRLDCPRTMIFSIVLGTITGLIYLICVLFSIQNVDDVISSSFGPVVTVYKQATGSNEASAGITAILLIILYCSSTEVATTSSRLTAAFARQGGLPFGATFARVNKKLDLPLESLLLTNAVVIILGCIYLGAATAFNAIVSACTIGLSLSYLIPILVLLARGRHVLPKGQFHLGRWGYPINIISALFLIFINVLFLFPSTAHPNASTMNYAIVAIGAVIIFATVYWFIIGHKQYTTPTIHIVDLVIEEESASNGENTTIETKN